MSAADALSLDAPTRQPRRPAPPHDPLSLLLAGWIGPRPRVGWRVLELVEAEITVANGALVLAPTPDAERRASEPSGTFGGLRLPLNVALGPRGDVYLLDPVSGHLLHFDPCACRFAPVPCFTRIAVDTPPGSAAPVVKAMPRRVPLQHLRDPHGLAICGGELFVADSGHGRIVQVALNGFVARRELRPPASELAMRTQAWRPAGLAFNGRGELHSADPANLRIDVFDAGGRWSRAYTTPRPAWHLAFDCLDRLHAVVADAEGLALVTEAGTTRWDWQATPGVPLNPGLLRFDGTTPVALDLRTDQLAQFAPPPFAIDAAGAMRLPCVCAMASFDARGAALPAGARAVRDRYRRRGHYLSQPLDSAIEACQWHRIELRGCLPEGCSVAVRSLSADIEFDADELALLPDSAWSAPTVCSALVDCRWDCLLRSTPGRFAWLRLELSGDGQDTPAIEAALVEYPRISLRRYLPAIFGSEPVSADFTDRFSALFDASLRSIEGRLDGLAGLFDPLSAPAEAPPGGIDFLSWLASWIGTAPMRDWPLARRRRFIKESARLFRMRGTPCGLREQLLLLLGFDLAYRDCPAQRPRTRCGALPRNCGPCPDCLPAQPPALLLEHFRLRRWLFAGLGHLGDDSMLWGKRIVDRSQLSGPELPPNASGNAQVGRTQLIGLPDPFRDPLLVDANRVSVFVPARVRDDPLQARGLQQLLAREVPAHVEAIVAYVEPRFRVGVQAMVGLDSVIARTPQGVVLAAPDGGGGRPARPLGQGTVLTRAPSRQGGPQMQVGQARVGTTTVLT